MRIHTDQVENIDLDRAAFHAGVTFEKKSRHGSRTHKHAWEIKLLGNSRRRPNGGSRGADHNGYAATWDQWGIFLAHLYVEDSNLKCWAYEDEDAFSERTNGRFDLSFNRENGEFGGFKLSDSHGDHTFRYAGVPCTQKCTKCDAIQRW